MTMPHRKTMTPRRKECEPSVTQIPEIRINQDAAVIPDHVEQERRLFADKTKDLQIEDRVYDHDA